MSHEIIRLDEPTLEDVFVVHMTDGPIELIGLPISNSVFDAQLFGILTVVIACISFRFFGTKTRD